MVEDLECNVAGDQCRGFVQGSSPKFPPGALGSWSGIDHGVAAIAEGTLARRTAIAEVDGLSGLQLEDVWCGVRSLVAAVAVGTVLAQAAGAEGMVASGQIVDGRMGWCAHRYAGLVDAIGALQSCAGGLQLHKSALQSGLVTRR